MAKVSNSWGFPEQDNIARVGQLVDQMLQASQRVVNTLQELQQEC